MWMESMLRATAVAVMLCGCEQARMSSEGVDGGPEMTCPSPPDLATPASKCAAAKGLAGDNLLCVDFKDVQALTSLSGWDFFCAGGASWGSTGGSLQVNNFGTFDKECTATLPKLNLNDADKQKYKSLTLSLVHRIDLNDPEQNAEIYLNSSTALRRMWQGTGKRDIPRQVTTITIDKADLPVMLSNSPQWVLKVSSTLMVARMGWQIESIAINGVQ